MAQAGRMPRFSLPECREAVGDLADSYYRTTAVYTLGRCGERGAEVLVRVIQDTRGETDLHFLRSLSRAAGRVQHPGILRASIRIALDKDESRPVRTAALLIVYRQAGSIAFLSGEYDDETLLAGPFPEECRYAWLAGGDDVFVARYQMALGYLNRIENVLKNLAADETESAHMRNLATCLRRMM